MPVPPRFNLSEATTDLTAIEGEEVILSCPVTGSPKPRTSWYKEGRRLHPGPLVQMSQKHLTFISVRSHDTGTYACAAINEAGAAELSITLTVYGKET